MRLSKVVLLDYKTIDAMAFEAAPLTVLFGKNNAGKSNIMSAIYDVLEPESAREKTGEHGRLANKGAFVCLLDENVGFDDEVSSAVGEVVELSNNPAVAFLDSSQSHRLLPADPTDLYLTYHRLAKEHVASEGVEEIWERISEVTTAGPRLSAVAVDWEFAEIHTRVDAAIAELADEYLFETPDGRKGSAKHLFGAIWLEPSGDGWRVRPAMTECAARLSALASDLLPDFLDGAIDVDIQPPFVWHAGGQTNVGYVERSGPRRWDQADAYGQGTARWLAAAVQIAIHLMGRYPELSNLRDTTPKQFSGSILLIDEPEAHLHPGAVASTVRWCRRMVELGFTVVVASHHDEYLRAAGHDVSLVHVTRDNASGRTEARSLPSARTTRLLELAQDVGMNPAVALALHRAVLFVEGPLDEAVLLEYAELELDAGGVKVIPIHGTKNLEGLVAVELVTELGINMGVLTDATDPATMAERSGRKRSSEERKVLKVLQIASEKGLPKPAVFGVSEADLLFALPIEGIRDYLQGPFPEWAALVAECRQALGKGPSDSVNWKAYAQEHYGLPLATAAGVRHIVRALDLASVPLPAIRRVVDEVLDWAKGEPR